MLLLYALMSQIEQPAFCVHILKSKKIPDFNPETCSTPDDIYTHFDLMRKYGPEVTRPLETFLLLSLILI